MGNLKTSAGILLRLTIVTVFASFAPLAPGFGGTAAQAAMFYEALSPQAQTGPSPSPSPVVVTPDSLREILLEGNIDIQDALIQVKEAKDSVRNARAGLLPSVSIGAAFGAASGPNFLITSIDFLLPFLIPSNWFEYYEQKDLFEAQKIAYRILQENAYAAAASVYYTTLGDLKAVGVFEQQEADLSRLAKDLQDEYDNLGNVDPNVVKTAVGTAQQAAVSASAARSLVVADEAAMRKILGISQLKVPLVFPDAQVPPSPFEGKAPDEVVDYSMTVAPEAQQVKKLLDAAKLDRWKTIFAFVTGASVGSNGTGGRSASFGDLSPKGSVGFGFGTFPELSMNSHEQEAIGHQIPRLRLANGEIVETSLGSIREANQQFANAAQAEQNFHDVYQNKSAAYDMGFETIFAVLQARAAEDLAATSRIKAETNLNLLRLELHRALMSDQFALIKGCDLGSYVPKSKASGAWGWVKGLFSAKGDDLSIDQACRYGYKKAGSK